MSLRPPPKKSIQYIALKHLKLEFEIPKLLLHKNLIEKRIQRIFKKRRKGRLQQREVKE